MRCLALLAFAVSTASCASIDTPSAPPGTWAARPLPDRIVLTWSADPATTQTVTWRTDPSAGDPVAEFAVATDGPTFAKKATRIAAATTTPLGEAPNGALYHTAVLRDLEPRTKYAYRVGDGDDWSEWSHFTTASDEAAPFSFLYFGDAQNDIKSHWSRVVREAFKDAPRAAFALHAGDLVNHANADDEWGEWFYSGGWIFRTMPQLATPGNHEYNRHGLSKHWEPTFEFPRNGPDDLQSSVFWLDHQGVRFVSLDSNRDVDPQAAWLDSVLQDNPCRWTIVTLHHPLYSTAKGRDNAKLRGVLQPVFDRHGVDLVLQGHDHSYGRSGLMHHGERVPANLTTGARVQSGRGTVYVVSVSGPKMYSVGERPLWQRTANGKQLYQVLSIDGAELRYAAYTATGELFDRFVLRKGTDGRNTLQETTP
ncbi:MAG: metallophosphoesterase family protein [Planctomycetota bacterium]